MLILKVVENNSGTVENALQFFLLKWLKYRNFSLAGLHEACSKLPQKTLGIVCIIEIY